MEAIHRRAARYAWALLLARIHEVFPPPALTAMYRASYTSEAPLDFYPLSNEGSTKAMSMQPAVEAYTVQDYLQWEGDWELIHGQPVAMVPSPSFDHQQVSAAVFRQLDESLDDCPYCQAVFEIDVEFAQDTVVRPDVLVICYQPESERLTRAPDLIFEVISPKTTRRDEVVKFELYRTEGVPHYVLVYPEAKKAKVWRLVEGEYRKVGDFHDETHCFKLSKCAFDFDFSRLWKRKGGQP